MTASRIIEVILIAVGIVIAVMGFFAWAGAGLPYQDPTPALLRQQQQNIVIAQVVMGFGLGLAAAVLIWGALKTRNPPPDGD
jgi:Flp pilus assembly protein CpaB